MPRCHYPPRPESCATCKVYVSGSDALRAALDRVAQKTPEDKPAPKPPSKRWKLNCIDLGKKLPGQPCGSDLHTCMKFGDVTAKIKPCKEAARDCQSCESYVEAAPLAPLPPKHRAGVVIGSYGWPELIRLQVLTIRETCGADTPILVADDATEGIRDVCSSLGVECDSNPKRIGHTGGDVSAFNKAIRWGAAHGMDTVAKLSQRFIITRRDWLAEGRVELLASGLPLAGRRCTGTEVFDLRTEACLLHVPSWNKGAILERTAARVYWKDAPTGLSAERIIFRVLQDALGGRYWPWSLISSERYEHRDGVIWHCADGEKAYREHAFKMGVTLDADFHAEGRLRELKAGTYAYG